MSSASVAGVIELWLWKDLACLFSVCMHMCGCLLLVQHSFVFTYIYIHIYIYIYVWIEIERVRDGE